MPTVFQSRLFVINEINHSTFKRELNFLVTLTFQFQSADKNTSNTDFGLSKSVTMVLACMILFYIFYSPPGGKHLARFDVRP